MASKSKAKDVVTKAGLAGFGELARRAASAASSAGTLAAFARSLKSTTLWTAVGIAALQGSGVVGLLDANSATAGTLALLAPIVTERIKKGF